MRSPAVTRTSFRRRLGTELLEDRTQPSFLNFAAHVPGFLDGPGGHGASDTFTPPGHSDGHPGLALGLTEVVQFSTPGRGAVLDLILPFPAGNAANSDVILIVFPGQGGGSSGSGSGDDGSFAGSSATGATSGAAAGGSSGGSGTSPVTGADRSFTPISLVRAVSGTQFTTNNPVATSIAAATGSALAILLPPNAGAAATTATGTTLIALPPGIGTNTPGTAGTVSPATPANGASAAVAPSTLPFGFALPSFPAIEGPHGPVTVAVAPLPHVPVPVELDMPVAPAPTPAEPVGTTPVVTAEGTAAATTTATSADQPATAAPEEEGTTSRWTWFGAAALAVGGVYWAARRYVRARRGNLLFRRRLAALPLGTILSTDLERA